MPLIRKTIPPVNSAATAVFSSKEARSWTTLSGLFLALLIWNWALAVALAIASVTGTVLYLQQEHRLGLKRFRQSRVWKHHQSLWIALSISVGVFVASYGTIALVQASTNPWVTLAMVAQGLGTLSVLGVLVWDKVQARSTSHIPSTIASHKPSFHEALRHLTAHHPVNRLIAIRTIAKQVMVQAQSEMQSSNIPIHPNTGWSVTDTLQCFRLIHQSVSEPMVKQAIQDEIGRLTAYVSECPHTTLMGQSKRPFSGKMVPNLLRTRKMVKTPELLGIKN